jgi:hypothetical protein
VNGEGKTIQFGAGFRLRKGDEEKIYLGFFEKNIWVILSTFEVKRILSCYPVKNNR